MNSEKVLRLSATEEHNRNSEGSFVELKDGTILFAYSRYSSEGWNDHAKADIVLIRSTVTDHFFWRTAPAGAVTAQGSCRISRSAAAPDKEFSL